MHSLLRRKDINRITEHEEGRKLEPIEEATVDVPSEYAGKAIEVFGSAGGEMTDMFQRGEATHAGIYVGADRFVHAPSTGGEVRLDNLRSKYWATQLVAYRRP